MPRVAPEKKVPDFLAMTPLQDNFRSYMNAYKGITKPCKSCGTLIQGGWPYRKFSRCHSCHKKEVLRTSLKETYDLTLEQYEDLLIDQLGVCAICGKRESVITSNKKKATPNRLSVDHCHSSGKVRGLLCSSCNLTLGMVKDDVSHLAKMITYLEKYK